LGISTLLIAFGVCIADILGLLHAPHDPVYSLAAADLPNGDRVVVAVGTESAVIFTRDGGLSWQMLAGQGLEVQTPWEVTYHPALPAAGGAGLFLIGTERGVWTWDPVADVIGTLNAGLGASDLHILDLESPLAGSDGPAIALSIRGTVHLLDPLTMVWQPVFSTGGVFGRRGMVALNPHFDSTSGAPRAREMWVCASGQLWGSVDGGGSWLLHPQFSTTANSANNWNIPCVALSEDYTQDGLMMLGRVKLNQGSGTDVGEIWRSQNGGMNFQRVKNVGSGVMHLLATPPGPGGVRSWLASTRSYPNVGTFQGTGILVSVDGGTTWDDYGNDQDFLMEDSPGKVSGNAALNNESQMICLPQYGVNGDVWFGRQEGLFVSDDQGIHWEQRQMRAEREFRDLDTSFTPDGSKAVFGAGYGVGSVVHLPALGVVNGLPDEPPMIYQRRLDVSPNFVFDGNLITAGNVTLWCWQSDLVPPANPNGNELWWQPENRDPFSGEKLTGFPRVVAYSPNFDGRALPGTDQTFFWCGWDFGPYRSEDNGLTAKALHTQVGGAIMPEITCFGIAPTYDATAARTDAYVGEAGGRVYRLVNDEWLELADLGPLVEDILISPAWSRPANPSLFVALAGYPYVVELRDDPGGLTYSTLAAGLPEVDATGLAADPDFANSPVLYLSTFGSGTWKLDLAAGAPAWQPLGLDHPRRWGRDVAVSADFSNDRMVYIATQEGIWQCADLPGATWSALTTSGTRDESDESFQYYQPNDPANAYPDHAWPWLEIKRWTLPFPLIVFGEGLRYTSSDGAYATTVAECSSLTVLAVGGPSTGTIVIEASDLDTGLPVASTSLDLGPTHSAPKEQRVSLDLGSFRRVRIKVIADLDAGELLVLDGIEFKD